MKKIMKAICQYRNNSGARGICSIAAAATRKNRLRFIAYGWLVGSWIRFYGSVLVWLVLISEWLSWHQRISGANLAQHVFSWQLWRQPAALA